mmetsp:Transcript_13013/g.42906  ORF Transcript_13013/g.42906 Transcript_13013/m.42906 type:complete len:312 (-) Transcript_13013:167-1102(-)
MGCGASAMKAAPEDEPVAKRPRGPDTPTNGSYYSEPTNLDDGGEFNLNKLSRRTTGEPGTLEYRMHFEYSGKTISPWHEIPLRTNTENVFHFCCEIPKWTRAKFEVATKEEHNPIKQDEKKGVLREYKWGDMLFNYGFFPQTWEDPDEIAEDTGAKGDDDPLDVVEVGARQMVSGQVARVKVLGVLGMIDDGETDWKMFVVRTDDPLASKLNDIDDLERELPGCVNALREWLRVYKVPEGKPVNKFALEEKAMPAEYALKVLDDTHQSWKRTHGSKGTTLTMGRRGSGMGILPSPSMSELKLAAAAAAGGK